MTIYEYANNTKSKNSKRNKTIRDYSFSKDIRYDFEYFIKLSESSFENMEKYFEYTGMRTAIYNKFGLSFDYTKNRDIRRSITPFHTVRGDFYRHLASVGCIRSKGGIYD